MRRVISYAYFRNDASVYEKPNRKFRRGRQFVQFLPLLVRGHHAIWPDWTLRIHHDERIHELPYWDCLKRMEREGLLELHQFFPGTPRTLCGIGGMLERLRPAFEVGSEYVLCRDIDSIPTPRDRAAVDDFIKSGHAVHVIHDAHPHGGMMGGTLGIRCGQFEELVGVTNLEDLVGLSTHSWDWNKHGTDQDFLNQVVLPLVESSTLVHELDRPRGEMPRCHFKYSIDTTWRWPSYSPPVHKEYPGIGVCAEPIPWLLYYDNPMLCRRLQEIKECEGTLYFKDMATPSHKDIES